VPVEPGLKAIKAFVHIAVGSIACCFDVCGSVHHSATHTAKNPTRCNIVSKFIILYLYEAQHVSGDTPSIIRSLKLH
jgi:hypothetical protein